MERLYTQRLCCHPHHRRFHRADFQGVLLHALPDTCQVLCSKRVLSYTSGHDGVNLLFVDGSTVKCDILIGADGFQSALHITSSLSEQSRMCWPGPMTVVLLTLIKTLRVGYERFPDMIGRAQELGMYRSQNDRPMRDRQLWNDGSDRVRSQCRCVVL